MLASFDDPKAASRSGIGEFLIRDTQPPQIQTPHIASFLPARVAWTANRWVIENAKPKTESGKRRENRLFNREGTN